MKKTVKGRRGKKRGRSTGKKLLLICLTGIALVLGYILWQMERQTYPEQTAAGRFAEIREDNRQEGIPRELWELQEKNPETCNFVMEYPNRKEYLDREISLAEDSEISDALEAGTVPLLMQWDVRWGYDSYGDEMVGLAGCGPVCLCMAYIYLTGDLSLNPADVAKFACEEGFYTEYGTDWALWTQGAALLGLCGEELGLDENKIKSVLDGGGVVICSMRPGDFTTTGHFILLRDYDDNGFYVNDPNRKSNSERQWSYNELSGQIKNLWGISSGSL